MSRPYILTTRVVRQRKNRKGEVPIYYRLTIQGKRAEISSGHFVNPSFWDDNAQKVKLGTPNADELNQLISVDQAELYRLYAQSKSLGETVDPKRILKSLHGVANKAATILMVYDHHAARFKELLGTDGHSVGRFNRYRVFRGKLAMFLDRKYKVKDYPLSQLSNRFIVDFEGYLKTQDKLTTITANGYLKILKRLVKVAIENEWMTSDPFAGFRCKSQTTNRGFLTTEELKVIEAKEFATERLEVVRDLFVFSCYTGLSYSDAYKLTPANINKGVDGKAWIFVSRTKTNVPCQIPLLPQAEAILSKYKNHPECGYNNKLLPLRANQKMNEYLKEIGDLCGIGKRITFHVSRHTFATTILLDNGVSMEAASKLLGHRNIRTTQIYGRMTANRIAQEMNSLSQKLK